MEHWIVKLFGYDVNMDTLITMWTAMVLLIIVSLLATRKLSIFPTKIQLIFEGIINYFTDIASTNMNEKEARKHTPLLLTLFMFILSANLLGQLPWKLIHLSEGELASCNNDINMTAAMAIVVSVYYVFYGIKTKGFHFFIENFKIDGIMVALVDLLELVVRPFSLALRLFANIMAGEILVFTFASMCAVFLPIPFMFFEIFVAVVQALVFTLLSTTYISLAVNKEEE
ncbi:MAG: F0F1 ATP synthase subunit A [Candidatus Gastranaerophilales bacterium]|nr:F0F1 ATP synthase subunit A [Candidatus Gastranaerophilales bacterium]